MDQIMVDVSDILGVEMGTKVTLLGQDGDEIITADDMADAIGTIGYEIVCNISKRVERKYKYEYF
jgi:alanine racemase